MLRNGKVQESTRPSRQSLLQACPTLRMTPVRSKLLTESVKSGTVSDDR